MNELMSDTAWLKAFELVKEKYGKNLSYRSMKLIAENSNLIDSDYFYNNGDDLIIPLKIKNMNLGDVVVDRGSLLNQQQKAEIADLVKFLVEPKIYSLQLRQSEENLNKMTSRTLSLVESTPTVINLYHSEKNQKETLSHVILLKSHTELTRNKVALKIHEMTGRNLFVHLEDIALSLTSVDELHTLTDMTIYINDIEALPSATLNLLQAYLMTNTAGGPLLLIGSNLSIDGINAKDWSDSVKKDLTGFYFDIDRVPLSQQTSPEILELLFFQLESVLS